MSDLDTYLGLYYQTTEQFAAACSISPDELTELVGEKLVPQPSYTVAEGGRFTSQAFGDFQVEGLTPERYFHPGNAAWVALALQAKEKMGAQRAYYELKTRFRSNFAAALKDLDNSTFRLPDSFTDDGQIIAEGLDARTSEAWDTFLEGVFSLCVADPSSEQSIARKEILQEALTKLSDNGSKCDFSAEARRHVLQLIAQYAQCAMPFSPLEYPRSSRKRLVEDLGAILNAL